MYRKLFNSHRATRETDLMDEVGLRKACMYIGRAPEIAMKHYSRLKNPEYEDQGEYRGAAKIAAAGARNELQGVTQKNADVGNPNTCVQFVNKSDPEGARTLNLRIDSLAGLRPKNVFLLGKTVRNGDSCRLAPAA
ncbi:MAG: hypothetical protein NXI32_09215 [bacterium]|nr:hypothetical protein [bacterium]